MEQIIVLQQEQQMLRNELAQLKNCQLQYFTLSVTGTAGLFGLAATWGQNAFLGFAFLAPLAIILPCWWIFFDKATTITRIVGYYRVIERMVADYPNAGVNYIGYERALAFYRKEDDKERKDTLKDCCVEDCRVVESTHCPKRDKETVSVSRNKIRHRYWLINWYTYLMLSIACCSLSLLYMGGASRWYLLVPIVGFCVIARFAFMAHRLMRDVVKGKYTYNENHCFWEYIHKKYSVKSG